MKIVKMYGGTEAFCHKTVKLNRGVNQGVHFHNLEKKDRTIYKIKTCAQKCMLAATCCSCRVYVEYYLLSKLGTENMRLYRNDSNTW